MLQAQLSTKPVAQPGISESLLHEGDMVGRMDVTRLGISVIILQGSSADTLRHGIGHIVGTPLPGEVGNSTLAGHRDTYFRQLRNIQPTDNIQIQTSSREFIYTVDWTKVVSPDETSVLKPSQDARSTLTLVTCYPFYYIGPAPKRFIVHARLNAVQERQ
jgi:sortase A